MVDYDCKTQLASPGRRNRPPSPKLSPPSPSSSIIKLQIPSLPAPFRPSTQLSPNSESTSAAYEQYLRLHELHSLWSSTTDFPGWETEPLLKPSLQALEITFRFISIVFSDPRPYSNHLEWSRRLESLATKQIDIIARICEDDCNKADGSVTAPIFNLNSSSGVLDRRSGSSAEVWRISSDESDSSTATATVVSRVSEASLLPRLAAWGKSERVATKIMYAIECGMRNCPYTLGLGEPNLSGKPILDYDAVCKPSELHALKKSPTVLVDNQENQTIYSLHQILECWIQASKQVLTRIGDKIDQSKFEQAASECWLLEQIWNLMEEIERVHLLMDPDDFLRVKAQLRLGSGCGSDQAFCFRSKGLIELTKRSKGLKHKVPEILGVEVDPIGGPIIQEAAMKLYKEEKKQMFEKIHLLQALQAVEVALKRFYFGYKQVLVVVMGSLNANGNGVIMESVVGDSLAQIFLEPTYYPSLDGAKTFLGGFWERSTMMGKAGERGRVGG